jgi:protein TonB
LAASKFFPFGGRRRAFWFPRLQWGWLAAVAGAHAAGLLALSTLESGEPARPTEPVMVVRLIAPANSAPTPAQSDAPARAVPRTHDDIPPPKQDPHTSPAPVASSPRPSSTAAAPAVPERKPAISATGTPPPKERPPARPPDQRAPVAVKENTSATPSEAQRAEPAPVAPSPAETKSTAASTVQNPRPPAAESAATAPLVHQSPGVSPLVTEARFDAAYLSNPAPSYPRISRRRGEEGRVLLRVRVLADGAAGAVEIAEGSGHPRLDDAARDAVRSWRFVPASRGDLKIDSWLNVPIVFRLED